MELRRLEKSDFRPQYFALLRQLTSCNDDRISKNSFDQFIDSLSPFHQIWVLEENGRIVGTGTLLVEQKIIHDMGKVGHIEDIVIDSMCRGVGLGEKLVKHLKETGFKLGCYKVILNCSDDKKGFYQKCGFQQKGNMMESGV
jgi:glucosamine-phosphate N-acetyltransferase